MEDDSDEYEFAKCNIALLKETIRELKESDLNGPPRRDWPMLVCPEDDWDDCCESETAPEVAKSPTAPPRKRSLSASSGSTVKRVRRRSAPASDSDSTDDASTPPPAPSSTVQRASSPPVPATPPVTRVDSDLPPPPSSSELTMTVLPPVAPSDAPEDGLLSTEEVKRLAALPAEQLTSRLKEGGYLLLEPNLVRMAASPALGATVARLWLTHVLTPKLLCGEVPSAELVSALVGLACRHPEAVTEHCLLPLAERDRLTCDDLVLRVVTDGLQSPHRAHLVRRLCGRPVSTAAVSFLLSLLPVCPLSADLAGSLAASLAAAAGAHRSSAAFARLLLVTVQRAGRLLDAEDRARLAAAAEHGQTALRRTVQAALRRLD